MPTMIIVVTAIIGIIVIVGLVIGLLGSPDPIDSKLASAELERVAGDPDAAVQLAEEVLAEQPDNAEAHATLGRVAHQRGAFAEAAAHFERSLEFDQQQQKVWRWLIEVQRAMQDYGAMQEAANSLIRLWPEDSAGYVARAEALLGLESAGPALEAANTAVEHGPHEAKAYIARARAHMAHGNPDAARDDLHTAARIEPDNTDIEQIQRELRV